MYLTVAGSLVISQAVSIRGVQNQTSGVCTTTAVPTVSWAKAASNTLQWLSTNDILTITIPNLQNTNNKILAQYGVTDVAGLRLAPGSSSDLALFASNVIAIEGWTSMIASAHSRNTRRERRLATRHIGAARTHSCGMSLIDMVSADTTSISRLWQFRGPSSISVSPITRPTHGALCRYESPRLHVCGFALCSLFCCAGVLCALVQTWERRLAPTLKARL